MFNRLAIETYRLLRTLDQPARFSRDGRPRGMALILALVTLVLLSTAVIEFAYSARVNLVMATNERDQLKSQYLARSAVNLSRLLLAFQYALQDETRGTEDEMGRMIGQAMRRSNFQLYQYIDLLMGPFNSGRIDIPLGSIDLESMGIGGFGQFSGNFEVEVIPEEGRIDLNGFAREGVRQQDLLQLCMMVLDGRYDSIFEERDRFGELMDRARVVQNIIDFIDLDEEGLMLGDDCSIQGTSGDESRPYDRDDDHDIRPRNAKLTHVEELYMVHGVSDVFMEAFKDHVTVYGVGRPNLNVATAPVLYAVLCQHVQVEGGRIDGQFSNPCAQNPAIAQQVFWLSLALDGIRDFFENPISVLLAYVGSTESRLLPSARVGQPVAYLSVSQLPSYITDLKDNPEILAQFLNYSPTYRALVAADPSFYVDPLAPALPVWNVDFNRTGLMRSVTIRTPMIYRIRATGTYGYTRSRAEAVVDFSKTLRRLPSEQQVIGRETDSERIEELRTMLRQQQQEMARGRLLYWREY
jgi:hypothetical protein